MTDPAPDQPTDQSLTDHAVKSFAWSALAFGGSKLVVFISTVVLARILTPNAFGIVAAATALIVFFDVVLDLGVGAALIYEQERGVTHRAHTAFTLNLIISSCLTLFGVLITPYVASFFGLQNHEDVFRAMFLYLFVRGLGQVQDSMLQRDLRFARRASVEIAQGVARAAVSIGLALAGFGVWALVGGLLAGEALGTALSWWAVGSWPRLSLDRQIARALMGFGLTFISLKVVDAIAIDSDYLVVGHGLGATQLGYYSMAYRLPELALTSLYWMVGAVSFPIYAQARARGYGAPMLASLRALRLITLFSFPAGVLLALVSREVVYVMFSSKWSPAIWPMVLISLMTAVTSIGYASGDLFPALGRPGTLLVLNAPLTLALVIGFVIVVPYGIVAIAIAHLAMALVAMAARLMLVSKLFDMKLVDQLRAMWPGVCAVIGVLLLAGPLRLLMPHGPITLIALLLAGALGAAGGLLAGSRGTFDELHTLATSLRPAASP